MCGPSSGRRDVPVGEPPQQAELEHYDSQQPTARLHAKKVETSNGCRQPRAVCVQRKQKPRPPCQRPQRVVRETAETMPWRAAAAAPAQHAAREYEHKEREVQVRKHGEHCAHAHGPQPRAMVRRTYLHAQAVVHCTAQPGTSREREQVSRAYPRLSTHHKPTAREPALCACHEAEEESICRHCSARCPCFCRPCSARPLCAHAKLPRVSRIFFFREVRVHGAGSARCVLQCRLCFAVRRVCVK